MASKEEGGYKKPPKHTQFQKGKSGNPRGRPKGTKNLQKDLEEELNEKILIKEGNQPKRVSKQRAMVKSVVAQAVRGNPRSADQVLKSIDRFQCEDKPGEEDRPSEDQALLAIYNTEVIERYLKEKESVSNPDSQEPTDPADAAGQD